MSTHSLLCFCAGDCCPIPAFAAFCTPRHNRSPTQMGGCGPVLGAAFDRPQLFGSSIYTKFEKSLKFVKLLIL